MQSILKPYGNIGFLHCCRKTQEHYLRGYVSPVMATVLNRGHALSTDVCEELEVEINNIISTSSSSTSRHTCLRSSKGPWRSAVLHLGKWDKSLAYACMVAAALHPMKF